ncbi:MAG: type II toxin-antitoxin system HicB family antitoxin [Flavisolibacter sp.]
MPTSEQIVISFTPILTEDPKGRGYSGYLAEFPELFAQGATPEEVEKNLLVSLSDILEYRKQEALFQNPETKKKVKASINLVHAAL